VIAISHGAEPTSSSVMVHELNFRNDIPREKWDPKKWSHAKETYAAISKHVSMTLLEWYYENYNEDTNITTQYKPITVPRPSESLEERKNKKRETLNCGLKHM
jgi:hypothetical protein